MCPWQGNRAMEKSEYRHAVKEYSHDAAPALSPPRWVVVGFVTTIMCNLFIYIYIYIRI